MTSVQFSGYYSYIRPKNHPFQIDKDTAKRISTEGMSIEVGNYMIEGVHVPLDLDKRFEQQLDADPRVGIIEFLPGDHSVTYCKQAFARLVAPLKQTGKKIAGRFAQQWFDYALALQQTQTMK